LATDRCSDLLRVRFSIGLVQGSVEGEAMIEEVELKSISKDTCFVAATNVGKGRRAAVVPGPTAARYLHYGRITLDAGDASISFENNDHETGLICLRGEAEVSTGEENYKLGQYDSVYIPRDSKIEVSAGASGCDLAEVSAPVSKKYPARFVSTQTSARIPNST
jgi:5-deoxy-D-glucuronate isomerase